MKVHSEWLDPVPRFEQPRDKAVRGDAETGGRYRLNGGPQPCSPSADEHIVCQEQPACVHCPVRYVCPSPSWYKAALCLSSAARIGSPETMVARPAAFPRRPPIPPGLPGPTPNQVSH